jgi:hypothetical protein
MLVGRIVDNAVIETAVLPDGSSITDFYPERLGFEELPAGTKAGMIRNGSGFKAAPPPSGPSWDAIRMQRDQRLRQSDWTMLPDAPLSEVQRSAWATYRTALRDVPQENSDPAGIVWPDAPA